MVLHTGECSPSFTFLNVFGLFNKKKLKGLSGGKSLVRPISEPKRGVEEGHLLSLPGGQAWFPVAGFGEGALPSNH